MSLKTGHLFPLEFINALQLTHGLKELKRNNNNKKISFLNKLEMNSDYLKDFHSKGTGDSSYSSFYLGRSNGTEGMCQLRVRLFWRHTCLSQPHIPKDWLGFMSEQTHPEHPTRKLRPVTAYGPVSSSESLRGMRQTDNRLQLGGEHERRVTGRMSKESCAISAYMGLDSDKDLQDTKD